jgi:hypothetical protein
MAGHGYSSGETAQSLGPDSKPPHAHSPEARIDGR